MTGQKLMLAGVLALIGGTAFESEAQAGPFRRRARNANVDCACSSQAYTNTATNYGGVPLAMPVPGTGVVVPAGGIADGTRIPATGRVVPAAGVVPASESYYFDPRTGVYHPRNGSFNNQDFVPGVIQGTTGSSYYPSNTPANYAGRRIGRIFRR